MSLTVKVIFPAVLALGALALMIVETVNYPKMLKSGIGKKKLMMRMYRRIFGSILVIVAAFLIYNGISSFPAPTSKEIAREQLSYWTLVISLVLFVMLLALWDFLDSLKHIEKTVEKASKEDLESIKKFLEDNPEIHKKIDEDLKQLSKKSSRNKTKGKK